MDANVEFSILNALCELDGALLYSILGYVDVGSLVALTKVSKFYSDFCNDPHMWKLILKRDWSWPQPKRGKGAKKKQEKISEKTVKELKKIYLDKLQAQVFVRNEIAAFLKKYLISKTCDGEYRYAKGCSHSSAEFMYHSKFTTQVTYFYCANCTIKVPFRSGWAIETLRDKLTAARLPGPVVFKMKNLFDMASMTIEEPSDEDEEDENDEIED